MKKRGCVSLVVSMAFIFSSVVIPIESHACTGIFIKTEDGGHIFARTMEFDAEFMRHDLILVPRNYGYAGHTPSEKPGMGWTTKYSYAGFAPSDELFVDDGMNEMGLYCGGFFHAGYATYESVTEADYPDTIANVDLVSWALGTCASVAEVRERLPKIRVCGVVTSELGFSPPLQYFAADKTGAAIIIEYLDGKLIIHDNEANVITNSPSYDWQTTNLRNYIGLKPENNPPVSINGNEFAQFGQGSGAVGLPGDFTPPSRFVRASFFANTAFQGKDADEGVGIAFHILNQFDIPKGSIRGTEAGKSVTDTAQWTAASDLANSRYFYHTYSDRTVRVVDLKKIDPNAPGIKTIKDVQRPSVVEDVSGEFK